MNRVHASTLIFALAVPALAFASCAVEPDTAPEPTGRATSAMGAGTFAEVTAFGTNPGALKMYVYTPSPAPAAGAGVVVAMHACSQNATSYRAAGWEELADAHGFWVVYPEQQAANNMLGCFNWGGELGNPANQQRGQGENQSIKEMVDKVIADHQADPARVFAVGQSGGGAQAALMMATWPDVFAAGGIMAGIPYACTSQLLEVSTCLNPGKNLTPQQWGDKVRAASPGYAGPWPRLSVWHGTNDNVVAPQNMTELVEQWADVHGIATAPSSTDMVEGYPHKRFDDASGKTLIEAYEITGASHGTFVDPDKGCGVAGAYFIDEDICAAKHMAAFFGLTGGSGEGGGGGGGGTASSSSTAAAGSTSGAGVTSGAGATTGGSNACVPGRQVICECPGGGESFQTCASDGTYGACDCPDVVEEPSSCAVEPGPTSTTSSSWPALVAAVGAATLFLRKRTKVSRRA